MPFKKTRSVFWNGRSGYTVTEGRDVVAYAPAFFYSRKNRNRNAAKTNSHALELAQYRPEMAPERETIRRALTLFFAADQVWLLGDSHAV